MSQGFSWKPGAVYNFSSVVPGILPAEYRHMTLDAECSYKVAQLSEGAALYSKWRQIYPHLSPTVIDQPSATTWLIFSTKSNQTVVLASEWINHSTVVEVSFQQYRILLTESDYHQMVRVRSFLETIGAKFQIEEHELPPT